MHGLDEGGNRHRQLWSHGQHCRCMNSSGDHYIAAPLCSCSSLLISYTKQLCKTHFVNQKTNRKTMAKTTVAAVGRFLNSFQKWEKASVLGVQVHYDWVCWAPEALCTFPPFTPAQPSPAQHRWICKSQWKCLLPPRGNFGKSFGETKGLEVGMFLVEIMSCNVPGLFKFPLNLCSESLMSYLQNFSGKRKTMPFLEKIGAVT